MLVIYQANCRFSHMIRTRQNITVAYTVLVAHRLFNGVCCNPSEQGPTHLDKAATQPASSLYRTCVQPTYLFRTQFFSDGSG